MCNAKFEYSTNFEPSPTLLPNTHIVVRIDGRVYPMSEYLSDPLSVYCFVGSR